MDFSPRIDKMHGKMWLNQQKTIITSQTIAEIFASAKAHVQIWSLSLLTFLHS